LHASITDDRRGHESKVVPREKAVSEGKAVIERKAVVDAHVWCKVTGRKVTGVHCPHAADMPAHATNSTYCADGNKYRCCQRCGSGQSDDGLALHAYVLPRFARASLTSMNCGCTSRFGSRRIVPAVLTLVMFVFLLHTKESDGSMRVGCGERCSRKQQKTQMTNELFSDK